MRNSDLLAISAYHLGLLGRCRAAAEARLYAEDDFRRYRSRWSGVYGWLSERQGHWLFEKAKNTDLRGDIVEIGSAYGRSTVCLGLGVRLSGNGRLCAVDPHTGGKGLREQLGDCRDLYDSSRGFWDNMRRFDLQHHVTLLMQNSEAALRNWKGGKARLVFIDGWHSYAAVRTDILGWAQHVLPGGIIALHDYPEEGVRRAIHDCIAELRIGEGELHHVDDEMVYFRLP